MSSSTAGREAGELAGESGRDSADKVGEPPAEDAAEDAAGEAPEETGEEAGDASDSGFSVMTKREIFDLCVGRATEPAVYFFQAKRCGIQYYRHKSIYNHQRIFANIVSLAAAFGREGLRAALAVPFPPSTSTISPVTFRPL